MGKQFKTAFRFFILFLTVLTILYSSFVVFGAEHECAGKGCPVCMCIGSVLNLLLTGVLSTVVFALFIAVYIAGGLWDILVLDFKRSPISLHVKMNS